MLLKENTDTHRHTHTQKKYKTSSNTHTYTSTLRLPTNSRDNGIKTLQLMRRRLTVGTAYCSHILISLSIFTPSPRRPTFASPSLASRARRERLPIAPRGRQEQGFPQTSLRFRRRHEQRPRFRPLRRRRRRTRRRPSGKRRGKTRRKRGGGRPDTGEIAKQN